MKEVIVSTANEMQQLARELGSTLKGGEVLTFIGDLGFGKTTFIQGLAKGLGITRRIISPTFVIVRTYQLPGDKEFYHVDLYRLHTKEEVESLGIIHEFHNPHSIVAIEWPDRLQGYLPEKRIDIIISLLEDEKRSVIIYQRN